MLEQMIVLGLATSAISMTITRSKASESARLYLERKTGGQLINCPYCISHYVAFGLVVITGFTVVDWWPVNLVVATFCLVGVSALISGALGIVLFRYEDTIDKLNTDVEHLERVLQEISKLGKDE